jgi:hypothetical protein
MEMNKELIVLIIFCTLNIGCSRFKSEEPRVDIYIPRAERIKICVNEFLLKDVKTVDAFRICNGIYRGEL